MILVAAGSNLAAHGVPPARIIASAFDAVARLGREQARSSLYNNPAWPDPNDPPFVNGVAVIETDLAPSALLSALHQIELAFGRARAEVNAPRVLDLDLVAYHDEVRTPDGAGALALPHPRMAMRDFVLTPLCDIAPDWRHPVSGARARDLLARLSQNNCTPI